MNQETLHIENVDEEIEIEVYFDFQPEERMTRHYPGCDPSVEICEVIRADNGVELCLLPDEQERIEEILVEKAEENRQEQIAYRKYGYMLDY